MVGYNNSAFKGTLVGAASLSAPGPRVSQTAVGVGSGPDAEKLRYTGRILAPRKQLKNSRPKRFK